MPEVLTPVKKWNLLTHTDAMIAQRKALCTTADQSKAQRAVTTNHHREAGTVIIPTSHRENKEEI